MPARFLKQAVILAKPETEAGTDATPTGSANAILVHDMSIEPIDLQYVDRALIRGFFGGSEELPGPGAVKCSLSVEFAGAGAASTPPAWGALLRGCGVAEGVLTTPSRVEYSPISASMETLTIWYHDSGVLHKLLGVMGNCSLSAKVGEKPYLKFDFIGRDGGATAVGNATPTYTAWKMPPVMMKANAVDITLGCSYATGAFTGGTVYPSTGLELNLGNTVNFVPLVGQETVEISDRVVTGNIELDLTAAQEVALLATVKAGTSQGLGFTIGTTSGNKILVFGGNTQLSRPKKSAVNGKRLCGYSIRMNAAAGGDDCRLVSL